MWQLQPITCPMCGMYLHCFDRMKYHVKRHKLKYTLSSCQKGFLHQSHTKGCINTYTKEIPYQCEYCQKCFSQQYFLNVHMRTHKEKPYECEHCQKCFSQRSSLTRHVRTHTKEKSYQCEYCQKYFRQYRACPPVTSLIP